jgi:hypothetical protein
MTQPSLQAGGGRSSESRYYGRSSKGNLYHGGALIAQHVTSACLRPSCPTASSYLLYTSRTQTLHARLLTPLHGAEQSPPQAGGNAVHNCPLCVDASTETQTAMRPHVEQLANTNDAGRVIEAGATLIACPPGGSTVVVQMPRGNIEGIQLRLLVLESIALRLSRGEFGAAFVEAATERVDLNFVVDWLGSAFLNHAACFVEQIGNAPDVCCLLAALRAGSCIAPGCKYAYATAGGRGEGTAWPEMPQRPAPDEVTHCQVTPQGSGETFPGKVARCCQAIREACEARGGPFLQAVVMSHLRYDLFSACISPVVQRVSIACLTCQAAPQLGCRSGSLIVHDKEAILDGLIVFGLRCSTAQCGTVTKLH